MNTIKDVAKKAGVSVSTVSRFINASGYVGSEAKKKIINSIEELNFSPNKIAQSLNNKKMKAVALLVPDISNYFFSELAKIMSEELSKEEYLVLLFEEWQIKEDLNKFLKMLEQYYVEAMVVGSGDLNEEILAAITQKSISIVAIDRYLKAPNQATITINNKKMAFEATKHLIERNCQHIVHITGPQTISTARDRKEGYEEAIKQAFGNRCILIEGDFTLKCGEQAVEYLIENKIAFDAIFAANDLMAIGAIKQLKTLGYSVPQKVKICGFDGIYIGDYINPSLTTVRQPIKMIGRKVVHALLEMIEQPNKVSKSIVLSGKLIVKESTGGKEI